MDGVDAHMNVVHLSYSDGEGGAARAAYRLHQGLRAADVNSRMLVQFKVTDDETVISTHARSRMGNTLARLRRSVDPAPLHVYGRYDQLDFSLGWLPESIASQVARLSPHVVNMHWVCGGLMRIESLRRLNVPVVWTLHDMWPFTGGCHYSGGCGGYTRNCGTCPQLHSRQQLDLSRWVWRRKHTAWADVPLTIVTPSSWLGELAKASSLFSRCRVHVIPYGLNTRVFRPVGRELARDLLGLPAAKILVVFGALTTADPRKGFQFLQPALRRLSQSDYRERIEVVIFGSATHSLNLHGLNVRNLGTLHDDVTLALAYSAADVTVVPSVEENLPLVAIESLACGTPVVSFDSTGLADLVDHRQNGYRAACFEPDDLAAGIEWVVADPERWHRLSEAARIKAEAALSLEAQAYAYARVYEEVTGTGSRGDGRA
ncbi:MAG: glycosyltransferase family 4 protein [Chloroflexota bacterium]|nr:glycosyltransferase family 4 protein [Chloroflexota bacterium]